MLRLVPALALLVVLAPTLAAVPASAAGREVSKPLDAKLQKLDGGKVKLAELRGEPVLLELWASWCLPCRQQSAILEELSPEIEGHGIRAFAVNLGEETEVVQKHLERSPAAFPVLLDRWQVLSSKLRIGELPALVLLDADGRLVELQLGLAQRDDVLALLEQVS